jgi:plastocyanin
MQRGALCVASLLAVLAAAPLAGAGNDFEEMALGPVEDACGQVLAPGDEVCFDAAEIGEGVFGGLERFAGGVSFEDCRDNGDAGCHVEVANFYFASRVLVVSDGQTIEFENGNPPGGNRHSVMSSDWGCAMPDSGCVPVLPVPGANFGGGQGFAQALPPGGTFDLTVDVASLDPQAYVLTQDGTAVIAYHCYIHGAATMNAYIVVPAAG